MLERQGFQTYQPDEDSGQSLSPSHLFGILRRRVFHFIVPFLLILAIGTFVTFAWPARYLSEGKILISSQEIPSNLVQPTVATLANERIQIIQQRIITRDNLLALAQKYQLTSGWQGLFLGTEIVDFVKDRIRIKPLELTLQGDRKNAIAFTVGFDYEQPVIAAKVANELVTMILNEDVRSRTNFASETTKFLEDEVNRLQNEISNADAQIAASRDRKVGSLGSDMQLDDSSKEIAALKAELVVKSAIYSNTHPDIIALKRKIEALKKANAATADTDSTPKKGEASPQNNATLAAPEGLGIDALTLKRQSLREELTKEREKLSAARMGEALERGQHSERLEVIEQATIPRKPDSPNRPKIFAAALFVALMAASGFVFVAETSNPAIRRSADLYSVIDSHLVVAIPYVSTRREVRRRKYSMILALGILAAIVIGGVIAIHIFLPPLDVLFAKAMTYLAR